MQHSRPRVAMSLLAAGALALSACNQDHATLSYTSGVKVDCGGKQTLVASGSTAQANAMTRFIDAYKKVCPGQIAQLHRQRLGRRDQRIPRRQNRFRRIGHAAVRGPIRRRQTTMRRRRRLEPARGIRPDGHHLQPCRRRLFGARRADAGQDLQRHHHALGRPGPHLAQRIHAGRGHQGHLPQRRIRHHLQLPVLPAGRIRRSVDSGRGQDVQRRRRHRRRRATKAPRRW